MSISVHFKLFKGHAKELKDFEPALLHEMKAAFKEQREIETGKKVMAHDEWK